MKIRYLAGLSIAAVAIAVSVGSGAVTNNAQGGIGSGSNTIDQKLVTTDLGNIALVASGTTTHTLIRSGCAVANLKTWWSEYVGGSNPYLEYKNTSWNVPGSCGDPYGNFQLQFINNNGSTSGWFTQSDDETIPNDIDTRGAATSKAKIGYPDPDGSTWCYYTIVTAPWGHAQVLPPIPPC